MVGKAKDWFPNDKATHEWLNSMKKRTRSTYQSHWRHLVKFTGMTGDQILADRKADKDYKWEKKTIEFKRWLIDTKKKAEYTAKSATGAVRSFFAFHRMELKFRRTESTRLTEARRKTEDYRFSRDDLKKIADVAGLEEKYVVVLGKSFGLRAGDFLKLTHGDLEPYIDRPVPISIGAYSTQKESVKAYPFIDSDAQPIVKLMLEKMKREGRGNPNERMLTHKHGIQLSRILKRVAERAGIKHGNKIVRFHCLRKFLIDRLSSHMSTEKWKQIVGKKISEGAYVSPDSLREDYRRAMVETTFPKAPISEANLRIKLHLDGLRGLVPDVVIDELQSKWLGKPPEIAIPKIDLELEAIQRIAHRNGISMSDLMEGAYLISKDAIEIEIEEIRRERRRKQTNSNNCANGHNCQRIVGEEELPPLLAEGWHVAAVLPSGKVVISND
jgi:hypothetical protein